MTDKCTLLHLFHIISNCLAVSFDTAFVLGEKMNTNQNETRVAVISIIVENPDSTPQINEILHTAADCIIGRLGIPYRQKNISIISIVIDAELDVISSVSGKLGRLSGVTVKTAYSKK